MAFTKVLGPGIHTLANVTTHNINSSGIITATKFIGDMTVGSGSTGTFSSLTVTGNLGVGGTLTYMDVTNVDAVGIITAQEGIHFGIGATAGKFLASTGITTFTKVGIGTNNPQRLLDLHADNPILNLCAAGANDASIELIETLDGTKNFGETGAFGFRVSYDGGDNRLYIDGATNDTITNLISVTRVGGNIGIGTNQADDLLHIKSITENSVIKLEGTSTATGIYDLSKVAGSTIRLINTSSTDGNYSDLRGSNAAEQITSQITFVNKTQSTNAGELVFGTRPADGTMVERLRIDANGDINLGNNPTNQYGYRLNIEDNGPILYAQTASSGGTELKLYLDHSNTIANFGTVSSSHLAFVTANEEEVRITSAGKVGIGTTNPSQKVSIANGRVSIDVNNDYYGVWMDGDTQGENHISVGRWYNTGGGLKSGYTEYGINNLILENNHATAAHSLVIQPKGRKVAIGTHITTDELVHIKGNVKATDYVGDYPLSNRRINMNGDFKIAQRGTSKTGITGNGRYVWDRWYWQNHGPTVTHTQDFSTVPVGQGFRTAAKIETTVASSGHVGNVMALLYNWEGQDLIRLKYGSANAESLTISFWARSSQTGVFVTTLKHDSKIISEQHTISSANTYNKYTWVIPGDTADAIGSTGVNSGMSFYVYISTGDNTNSGAHQGSWAAFHNAHMAAGNTLDLLSNTGTFYITGIQVEHGEVATPYEHISYGDELLKCQRYYQQIGPASSSRYILFGAGNGTARIRGIHQFVTEMRDEPDVAHDITAESPTFYSYAGGAPSYTSVNSMTATTKSMVWDFNTGTHNQEGLAFDVKGSGAFITISADI